MTEIKKITEEWIKKHNPCSEALEWYGDYIGKPPIEILNRLIKAKKYQWANWFIVRVMTYKQYVSYAVYAEEQVIDIFEKKYPDDKRPRLAIEAAKKCIKNPSKENRAAWATAWEAGATAWAAAWAAADSTRLKIFKYGMGLLGDE